MMDRRTFLAMPLVFLTEDVGALDAALARMKATGRFGVVLIVPATERFRLGQRLWALTALESEVEAHELFAQAVFTVLTPELAKGRFGGVEASRLLLSPDGKLLSWDRPAWEVYANAAAFAASFRPFLHGERGERLAERGKALDATLTPELRDAAGKLDAETLDERLAAREALGPHLEKLAPWAAWVASEGPEARRRAARLLLSTYYAALPANAPGAKVPYGCRGPEHWDPCPTCGMARINERERMFVRVLTGDPKLDRPRRGDD